MKTTILFCLTLAATLSVCAQDKVIDLNPRSSTNWFTCADYAQDKRGITYASPPASLWRRDIVRQYGRKTNSATVSITPKLVLVVPTKWHSFTNSQRGVSVKSGSLTVKR